MWATTLFYHPHPAVQWGSVIGVALVAGALDVRTRRIPNALTGPFAAVGLFQAVWLAGVPGLLDSVSACVVLALPYLLLFAFAGGGAGDAKLMGGTGAWLGLANGAVALASVSLAGVLLGVLFAARRRRLGLVASRMGAVVRIMAVPITERRLPRELADWLPLPEDSQKMPYGAAIVLGLAGAAVLRWSVLS